MCFIFLLFVGKVALYVFVYVGEVMCLQAALALNCIWF